MVKANRRGPAAAAEPEYIEPPTSRTCRSCGGRFDGSGTDRRLHRGHGAGAGAVDGGDRARKPPGITVRTWP